MTIRVALVDDHTLFRLGLAELLDQYDDIEVVGVAGDADGAPGMIEASSPDVVLMDLNLPPSSGIFLLAKLQRAGLTTPVLMLTVSDDQEDIAAALRAGASGYLLKDMHPAEVVDAVRRATRGERVLAPAVAAQAERESTPGRMGMLERLTQRETQILSHLAQGESNKVIARELAISQDTVKLHVRHILAKLALSSRVEAAVFAVEHKMALTHALARAGIGAHGVGRSGG